MIDHGGGRHLQRCNCSIVPLQDEGLYEVALLESPSETMFGLLFDGRLGRDISLDGRGDSEQQQQLMMMSAVTFWGRCH
ncbi:unnamed protein product [Lampetra planeri]